MTASYTLPESEAQRIARAYGVPKWTDEQVLTMLDMWDRQGRRAAEIARHFGVSRSAILGLLFQVRLEADEHRCACTKPENRDGGMPVRWWRETGDKRAVQAGSASGAVTGHENARRASGDPENGAGA